MGRRLEVGLLIAVVLATGCREPEISDGPWVADVSRSGDTTVVRTTSGSIWERPARLVEELRLGTVGGAEGTSFGAITQVAVADDGTVFLYDAQVPQIYRFGASGELLGHVGREGEGPGEYSDGVTGMLAMGQHLLLADPGTGRLSAFSLEGEYQGSLGPVTGLRSLFSPTLARGPDGGVAVRVLTVPVGPGLPIPTPWPIGLELRGADGAVADTLPPQTLLGVAGRLLAGPRGDGVLVGSEADFLFELRRDGGKVVRVEMPFARAEYTEGEQRMLGRLLAPAAAADGKSEVDAPSLKGTWLEYLFSADGRVWGRRPISDRPGDPTSRAPLYQPSVLDVFGVDGSYLGVVPLPVASRPVGVTDTHLYVVELGSFDEPYLVRYRIEAP